MIAALLSLAAMLAIENQTYPNNGEIVPAPVTLEWPNAQRGNEYEVYLGTDPENLEHVVTIDKNEWALYPLKPGTTYYWRIITFNQTETVEWPVWEFTTDAKR